MTLRAKMTVSAVVVALSAGAAVAHDGPHHGDGPGAGKAGRHDMMEMMQRMHGMMGAGGRMAGPGPTGMPGGMGMAGPGGSMTAGMAGAGMMSGLDADGDGVVTPEEARTGLGDLLSEFDTDGDGTLSLAEFEALHSARIRETMVDRFQHLDADGDGRITKEEMQAPAAQMQRMQAMRERMMDGFGTGPDATLPDRPPMMDGGGARTQGN